MGAPGPPSRRRRPLPQALVTWAFNVAAIYVASVLLGGVGFGDEAWALLVAAVVLALANAMLKPVVTILALPVIVVTLGVALFFVNLLMLYVTDWVVPPFEIGGFGSAALATLIVWAVNAALHAVFRERRDRSRRTPST